MKNRFNRAKFEHFQLAGLVNSFMWIGPGIYAAIISTSIGILAEAVENVVETAFTLLAFLALRAARNSSALLFPHGTGKFEAISNAMLALALGLSGVAVMGAGVVKFFNPAIPENSTLGLIFLCLSLCIDTVLYAATRSFEQQGGIVVKSWRRMYLMNVLMTLSIIVCVYASRYGGIFIYLDPLAAVLIGVFMLRIAYDTLTDSVWELSDRAIEEDIQLLVLKELVGAFHSFDSLGDVRSRRAGGRPVIEVELGFERERSWSEVADACAALQDKISARLAGAAVRVIPSMMAPDH